MHPRARADDDDETSDASDARSDEDAFEDVRATDGFEDEEIDEDEAFNEEDEERFGEAFAATTPRATTRKTRSTVRRRTRAVRGVSVGSWGRRMMI